MTITYCVNLHSVKTYFSKRCLEKLSHLGGEAAVTKLDYGIEATVDGGSSVSCHEKSRA